MLPFSYAGRKLKLENKKNNLLPIKLYQNNDLKVANLGGSLAKCADFRAVFGEKPAIFHQSFGLEWRQKWLFWEPKLAISKNIFWKPWW